MNLTKPLASRLEFIIFKLPFKQNVLLSLKNRTVRILFRGAKKLTGAKPFGRECRATWRPFRLEFKQIRTPEFPN